MCAPLTVNCQQRKHRLTITDRIVPCIDPGSKFCKSGEAPPSQTWQVSSTDCIAPKLSNGTCDDRKCIENLAQYGEKVWKINYGLEKKKSGKGGKCVVQ